MSQVPGKIAKAVVGAAKVVSAPARGANIGISQAVNKGKGPAAVAAGAVKGFVAGVKHPNKINAAAKLAAQGPQGKAGAVHAIKKNPNAPIQPVNVKFKANAPMQVVKKLGDSGS